MDTSEHEHYWVELQGLFDSTLECICGERPWTQAEMDIHATTAVY